MSSDYSSLNLCFGDGQGQDELSKVFSSNSELYLRQLQDSSWLLSWGPSLQWPSLELSSHHLLCLHFIQASALVSFPDHPVSNQDFLSPYTLHLPCFPALLFFTALVYSRVHCVIACLPFWKVRSSSAGTVSYSSRNPVAKSIAWHM